LETLFPRLVLYYLFPLCIFTLLVWSCEIFCGLLSFSWKVHSCIVHGLQPFCFIRRVLIMGSSVLLFEGLMSV
jgi:hypothetical protein